MHKEHLPIVQILLVYPRRMRIHMPTTFNRRLRIQNVHTRPSMRTITHKRREPRRRFFSKRSNNRSFTLNHRRILQFRLVHPHLGYHYEITHCKTESIHRTDPWHAIHRTTYRASNLHAKPVPVVRAAITNPVESESRNQNLQSLCNDPTLLNL